MGVVWLEVVLLEVLPMIPCTVSMEQMCICVKCRIAEHSVHRTSPSGPTVVTVVLLPL